MLKHARLLGVCTCIAVLLLAQVGLAYAAGPAQTPAATTALTSTVAAVQTPAALPDHQPLTTTVSTTVTTTANVLTAKALAAPKVITTKALAAPKIVLPADRKPLVGPAADATAQNTVKGLVVNWAYRNEVNYPVSLGGGGWNVEARTDNNAQFMFQTLGQGIAVLNPIIAKGSGQHAMAPDLAVPVTGPADRMINVGIYGGDQYPTGLPMAVEMKPSALKVNPGEEVQFVVDVKNTMPHTVHEVMVTDLLPPGLTPTYIESSIGTPWIGGQFAAASIGSLDQNQGAVVTITAQLAADAAPDRALTTRANVIYQESVALQASATINGEIPNQLPETGAPGMTLPLGGLVLLVAIVGLRKVRLSHIA
jgi:uncharacterized repeat protein (TIGR01451 family)